MNGHNWVGKPMMNPEGKIGKVIDDANGLFRVLTVRFDDGTEEDLMLANMGSNPLRSQKWKWLYERDGKSEWVEWGQ